MEELTKQEEIEAIRQAQAEKLTPAQLKEELETEEALEELYQKAKLMVFEVGPERQGNPTAIVTGGQPGAGKSGLVKLAVQRFKESYKNFVILDVDQYRGMCRNSQVILAKYPELYSDITDKAVGMVMNRIITDAINEGYNFILKEQWENQQI